MRAFWTLLAAGALAAALPAAEPAAGSLTKVTGDFACEALGRSPADIAITVYRLPDRSRVSQSGWGSGSFSIELPPGRYLLHVRGVEVLPITLPVLVPEGENELPLGTLSLEPSVLASCYGKLPPPWHVKEARNLDAKATLADFKGRWTLLAFWAWW